LPIAANPPVKAMPKPTVIGSAARAPVAPVNIAKPNMAPTAAVNPRRQSRPAVNLGMLLRPKFALLPGSILTLLSGEK
jgi:hypothetical protein